MKQVRNLRELGAIIRHKRVDLGMTQAQLSSKAGVSRRWLIALETADASSPDASKIFDTLRALNLALAIDEPQAQRKLNPEAEAAMRALEEFDE